MKVKVPELDDDSRFHGDVCPDEQGKMKGIYHLNDHAAFHYSVRWQKPGAAYGYRGTVSMRISETDQIVEKSGAQKRRETLKKKQRRKKETQENSSPGEMVEPLDCSEIVRNSNVSCSIFLKERNACSAQIKAKIVCAAQVLYAKYGSLLLDQADKHIPIERMAFSLAIHVHQDRYVCSKTKNPNSQTEAKRKLLKVAELLGAVEIGKISARRLVSVKRNLGSQWEAYFKEAQSFLSFALILKKDSECENCFSKFLEKNSGTKQRNTASLQIAGTDTDILSRMEEEKLDAYLAGSVENGKMMGILLLKEAGLTSAQACSLTWKDLFFYVDAAHKSSDLTQMQEPQTLYLSLCKEETAGATHDYTFPVFPFGAMILCQRYTFLRKSYSETQLQTMLVVTSEANPKEGLSPANLTNFARNIVRDFGVSYAVLAGLKSGEQGAGVTLLLHTYANRLEEICGLKSDPSMLKFMKHQSLTNPVQADHYRSFTDATARNYLNTVIRRDCRTTGNRKKTQAVTRTKFNEGERILIPPKNPQYKTKVVLTGRLKPGQGITVISQFGCRIAAVVRPAK